MKQFLSIVCIIVSKAPRSFFKYPPYLLVFLSTVGIVSFASADVGITASLEHVENPSLVAETGDPDLIRGLALDASFERETENFGTYFNYQVSKQDFKDDLQSDRNEIQGSGRLTWKAIPEVLVWDLSNSRSNQVLDSGLPDLSNNQQVVDITSTGPTLTMPVGPSNLLDLQLDYSIADYEKSGRLDQDRKTINGSFTHMFSRILSGAIRSTYSESEFDGISSALDYDLYSYSAFVGLDYSSFSLSVEAGEYTIDRLETGSQTSPLRSVTASYTLNSFSEFTLNYRESVEDQLSDLSFFQGSNEGGVTSSDNTENFGSSTFAGVYVRKSESATYNFQGDARFNFQLAYSNNEKDPQGSGIRETDESIFTNIGIPLSQRLSVNLLARLSELTYSQLDSVQDRAEIRAGATYRASDQLNVIFSVQDVKQESESSILDYDDLRVLLAVSYRF